MTKLEPADILSGTKLTPGAGSWADAWNEVKKKARMQYMTALLTIPLGGTFII
jgi:hypothetical protein